MPFNITTFRSGMHFDGQRPNLFEVTIPNVSNAFTGTDLPIFAKGTSIPGATIGTIVVPYFGREIKLAGNRTFPEWTVTVLNDENFSIRSQFERWMNYINDHGSNVRGSASYVAKGNVKQYAKSGTGNISASYSFINMFPTDLSEITLDWGDNDVIEEYTVTFAYDYWTRTKGQMSGGKGVIADAITEGSASST
jgi:hypothetical protein